ncbi:MAG: guanylate kinase [Fusobacterium sp.]|nr:guanylate kinase [Fusobacterium sp.]
MNLGKLYVVSGPSGAGKSTVCKEVRKILGINLSISATSRAPREGEKNGVDYYFLTTQEFEKKIEAGEFLEYAKVHNNYYGTLKSEVENRLRNGEKIILEIDVQGGLQVKEKFPEAQLIFFKTSTKEELERRLRGRNTDSEETIALRLKNSLKELEYEEKYETTIINREISQACEELIKIIEKN